MCKTCLADPLERQIDLKMKKALKDIDEKLLIEEVRLKEEGFDECFIEDYKKGFKKGFEEGLKEGIEIAKKSNTELVKKQLHKFSDEEIVDIYGLELIDVQKLRSEVEE